MYVYLNISMSKWICVEVLNYILSTTIYIYIFFFIIRVKACAIPCHHQLQTRGDNTVSVPQGGTATPGATKQLFPLDKALRDPVQWQKLLGSARSGSTALSYRICVIPLVGAWWGQYIAHAFTRCMMKKMYIYIYI